MPAPKGNKYALGNKGGRPRKIEVEDLPAIGEEMVEYFEEKKKLVKKDKTIPFFSQFAREVIGVCEETLKAYCDQNEEFFGCYKKCKQVQKECLIEGGLSGAFNPTAFIFTAKNITDMRDRQEHEHYGKDGKDLFPITAEDAERYAKDRLQGVFESGIGQSTDI